MSVAAVFAALSLSRFASAFSGPRLDRGMQ